MNDTLMNRNVAPIAVHNLICVIRGSIKAHAAHVIRIHNFRVDGCRRNSEIPNFSMLFAKY